MKALSRGLILLFTVFCWVTPAKAQRAIPEDNLAYPVLITITKLPPLASTGNASAPVPVPVEMGSGFFMNNGKFVYLVTAKHVLFDLKENSLLGDHATLIAYPKNVSDPGRFRITLDLSLLATSGNIKPHTSEDVAVIRIGTMPPVAANTPSPPLAIPTPSAGPVPPPTPHPFEFSAGVSVEEQAAEGLVGVDALNLKAVTRFEGVLVGNDVMMFGYPTSLALAANSKIDFSRPLLRRGIVAGKNVAARSIILDCPSYQGDSGGPVVEIDNPNPFQRSVSIIGVMNAFVPFVDSWKNEHFGYINATLQNSGYSIITPMDFVLELLD
jgi:Trypsin-like peptidase domain